MGQYLKDAYAERDLAKALAKAHGLIDVETKKLSDKLHDLKLSHNRKKKALKKLLKMFEQINRQIELSGECWKWNSPAVDYVISICERALWSDGRFDIK